MRDDLLGYYERELAFLRRMGADFARRYPKIAARLSLEADKCEDPHVERMIEAFALLAGRVQLKLDDEFPEITESFLNVLYPHYLAPVPSMTIARFALDLQQAKLTGGYQIASDTTLYSRPVQGQPCRFRTSYPVTLFPLDITDAMHNTELHTRTRRTPTDNTSTLQQHTDAAGKHNNHATTAIRPPIGDAILRWITTPPTSRRNHNLNHTHNYATRQIACRYQTHRRHTHTYTQHHSAAHTKPQTHYSCGDDS